MTSLPTGWQIVPLEFLVQEAQSGFASGKRDANGTVQVRMNNVTTEGSWDWSKVLRVPASEKQCSKYRLEAGDVLVNTTNSPNLVGKAVYFSGSHETLVFSNHFVRLRLKHDRIDPNYLRRWLNLLWNRRVFEGLCTQWVNQASVRKEDLLAVHVPLPSLEEQRRIAAILDKADAVRRKRQQAIALTEELLRSAFLEMFGDPGKNAHQWTIGCIADIAEIVTDGTHQTPTRSDNGVMLLSARNIKNGYIDISGDVDFVPQDEYERLRKSYDPKQQDVLISCSGSVGRVTVVRDFGAFSMVRSVAVVRPKLKFINSEFLESLLHSAYLRAAMVKGSKQSSQANLFQGAIKELPVILPPLSLQERWQTFKLRVRETAKLYSKMQCSQTELFNSLLQRAFRGQL